MPSTMPELDKPLHFENALHAWGLSFDVLREHFMYETLVALRLAANMEPRPIATPPYDPQERVLAWTGQQWEIARAADGWPDGATWWVAMPGSPDRPPRELISGD